MPFGIRWIVCSALCAALTGCAANDLIVKRQTEAEAKLEHLIQAEKKSNQRLNELSGQIVTVDDSAKVTAAQLKQLQDTLRELRSAQDDLKARVILLAQQVSTPKIEVVNPEVPRKGRDAGPPPEYLKAFGLYSANNFNAAIEAFEAFLKTTPKSEYAANALYWIGECYYSLSDLPKARAAFQKTVDEFPASAKAPDALLKLGYTLAAMKEQNKATAAFEAVIKTYPGSPAADKARERLTVH